MEDSPLVEQSKSFALDIIKLCNQIKIDRRETVLVNQLMLSGASIGARVREAYARQKRLYQKIARRAQRLLGNGILDRAVD